MVTTMRSRDRVAGKRWDQKAERGYPNSIWDADQIESLEGHEGSGSGHLNGYMLPTNGHPDQKGRAISDPALDVAT